MQHDVILQFPRPRPEFAGHVWLNGSLPAICFGAIHVVHTDDDDSLRRWTAGNPMINHAVGPGAIHLKYKKYQWLDSWKTELWQSREAVPASDGQSREHTRAKEQA